MKNILKNYRIPVALGTVLIALAAPSAWASNSNPRLDSLDQRVRHELVMLPYYSVFDDLQYRVDGRTVTLSGAVRLPVLKSDAEGVVKHLEGVDKVVNNIEVLPLSPFDDRIRVAMLRSVFWYGPLERYAMGAVPSIHILVKNGNVTLTGVVANEGDRTLAYMRANGVPGVFSVTNDLRVGKS